MNNMIDNNIDNCADNGINNGINNEEKQRIIEQNKDLVRRFPFLSPRNCWTDEPDEDYDYSYTELDNMPDGWRKAFGEQMCQEIYDDLVANNCLDDYRILQIKEKFGGLRWYDGGGTDKINREIIPKYETLSYRTCIVCGKPSTKMSTGWICPYCDEHAPKNSIPLEECEFY